MIAKETFFVIISIYYFQYVTERTLTKFHFLRKLQISHSPLAPSSQVFLGLFKDFLKSLAYYTYFAADRVEKTFTSTNEETF